jgi:hypothetical protein
MKMMFLICIDELQIPLSLRRLFPEVLPKKTIID